MDNREIITRRLITKCRIINNITAIKVPIGFNNNPPSITTTNPIFNNSSPSPSANRNNPFTTKIRACKSRSKIITQISTNKTSRRINNTKRRKR